MHYSPVTRLLYRISSALFNGLVSLFVDVLKDGVTTLLVPELLVIVRIVIRKWFVSAVCLSRVAVKYAVTDSERQKARNDVLVSPSS